MKRRTLCPPSNMKDSSPVFESVNGRPTGGGDEVFILRDPECTFELDCVARTACGSSDFWGNEGSLPSSLSLSILL